MTFGNIDCMSHRRQSELDTSAGKRLWVGFNFWEDNLIVQGLLSKEVIIRLDLHPF